MPPPCCSVSAASRKAEKMPSIESGMAPMTKQLNSVTLRPVPAPARMRPAGMKPPPESAALNVAFHCARASGASAEAAALATRMKVSATSRSTGVPSADFSRYFTSQIWREISNKALSLYDPRDKYVHSLFQFQGGRHDLMDPASERFHQPVENLLNRKGGEDQAHDLGHHHDARRSQEPLDLVGEQQRGQHHAKHADGESGRDRLLGDRILVVIRQQDHSEQRAGPRNGRHRDREDGDL